MYASNVRTSMKLVQIPLDNYGVVAVIRFAYANPHILQARALKVRN